MKFPKSVLIKTPVRKRFGDCIDNPPAYDIVNNSWFRGTGRLVFRFFVGERRNIYGGTGKIRLFGFTWAVWAWDLER